MHYARNIPELLSDHQESTYFHSSQNLELCYWHPTWHLSVYELRNQLHSVVGSRISGHARYVGSHLSHAYQSTLMSQPRDERQLQLTLDQAGPLITPDILKQEAISVI